MNVEALKKGTYNLFHKICFVEMDDTHSVDLDTMFDWKVAELMLNEGLVK